MAETKRILLIDDEEDFCFFVRLHLERTGKYQVQTAYNGIDGIKKANTEKPDLILLDIVMPDLTGDEVAMKLMEIPGTEDIPIVFLTALASQIKEEKSSPLQQIGGRYFIAKPVNRDGLVQAIDCMLEFNE